MSKEPRKKRFFNQDKSWLQFNARVLQEAEDPTVPVIDRMRFLGIFSNNLDEFFRVRYANIKRINIIGEKAKKELGGHSPNKLLSQITETVILLQKRNIETYNELLKLLAKENIEVVDDETLPESYRPFVKKYFIEKVSPSVFTLVLSNKKTFPTLRDKSIYLSVKLSKTDDPENPIFGLIEIPTDYIGRFIELPRDGDKQYIMYLDDLIRVNLRYIFFTYDYDVIEAHTIKITRDAELDIDNDISKSFLEKISKSVRNRRIGDPVRFVYDREIPVDNLQFLMRKMELDSHDSLIAGGKYHNKKDYINFPNVGGAHLEYPKFEPVQHPDLDMDRSILDVISKKDALLYMPYHSFSYIIRFLREAALDPAVTEVQMSLYRVAKQSRIISALINAAKNGKKVRVMVELQARFDEANNIQWVKTLRREGIEVINPIPGLKVHSKICLVKRTEGKKSVRYAIIGTGNFHEGTAKYYTDYHLMTSNSKIVKEVEEVFSFFSAPYRRYQFKHLLVSPHFTRSRMERLIDEEIEKAMNGGDGYIFLKMNSLSDYEMIDKLYEASAAGVEIKLIIRGICCLIPGRKDLSENIEAISIIDTYLEHTRVFVFGKGASQRVFIGSADFMPRNLDHRVEVITPIYDQAIAKDLVNQMDLIWSDNVKARWHNISQDNTYRKTEGPLIRSQLEMYEYLKNMEAVEA